MIPAREKSPLTARGSATLSDMIADIRFRKLLSGNNPYRCRHREVMMAADFFHRRGLDAQGLGKTPGAVPHRPVESNLRRKRDAMLQSWRVRFE